MKAWREWRRLFGWWYLFIGLGFVLLGAHWLLVGDSLWDAIVRWLIAGGFFALAYYEFRFGAGRRK